MERLADILQWPYLLAIVCICGVSLAFYRLTLHPLAQFPGPRLAAITRFYEAYYDIVQDGQYTFKIKDMHNKYGPIIRISPYELHVSDPAFFDVLYRQDAHYHKYAWAVDAFDAKYATIFTADHHVHKGRRTPLNPFFSKARVTSHQNAIQRHIRKLCNRIATFASNEQSFELGAAITALARDVSNDFVLNKSYNSLDHEDFEIAMLAASSGAGQMWRLTKHIRWVAPTLKAIPIPWLLKVVEGDMKVFFRYLLTTQEDTRSLMAAAKSPTTSKDAPRTIVHEIMDSKLPSHEKTFLRMFEDVSTVSGAGLETTASALKLIFFHIFSNTEILQRLRAELATAYASSPSSDTPEVKVLEKLPYLTSVLKEGLRLSPAIASRMARISDAEIIYKGWRIPAGTPVGMTLILLHTDPASFPDPMRFDPDRWMQPDAGKKVDKPFWPFSKGTRMCLGMHLAWAEMYIAVSTIVQEFDLSFGDAKAEDFECTSDQFAIGTKAKGFLIATAMARGD